MFTVNGEPGCQGSLFACLMISSFERPPVPGALANDEPPFIRPFVHPEQAATLSAVAISMCRGPNWNVMMAELSELLSLLFAGFGARKSATRATALAPGKAAAGTTLTHPVLHSTGRLWLRRIEPGTTGCRSDRQERERNSCSNKLRVRSLDWLSFGRHGAFLAVLPRGRMRRGNRW